MLIRLARRNHRRLNLGATFYISFWLLLVSCRSNPAPEPESLALHVNVVVEGLLHPVGLASAANGGVYIAEAGTGDDDLSAGVSLMTADGQIGRIVSGLPSDHETGDFLGAALVAVAPDGTTLFLGSKGSETLLTAPLDPANTLVLPAAPLRPDELGTAMAPSTELKLAEPHDITFDRQGEPVITDSAAGLLLTQFQDGAVRPLYQFAGSMEAAAGASQQEPAPTGITRVNEEYYVTLMGACRNAGGSGQLVAVDESGHQRLIAGNLTAPVDVAQGVDGTLWLLEYAMLAPEASCSRQPGDFRPSTGQLSRVSMDGQLETVLTGLDFPGSILPMPDGSLLISETYNNRILRLEYGLTTEADNTEAATAPGSIADTPVYRDIEDMDAALADIIQRNQLQANPGLELREGDTPLARLGQLLFFDPILSGDENISCATCHHPALAMADGRVLAIGTGGYGLGPEREYREEITIGPEGVSTNNIAAGVITPLPGLSRRDNPFDGALIPRNSQTVLNAGLLPAQFWDGRVANYIQGDPVQTLEQEVNAVGLDDALVAQALFPIVSMHEMAGVTLGDRDPQQIRQILLNRIRDNDSYRQLFADVFGTEEITIVQAVEAIAAFERRLIFTDSPWDDYLGGDQGALSDQQKRGALLFFGELLPSSNCAQCHSGDLFTDLQFHNLLVPQIGPGKGKGEAGWEDWGRAMVSFDWRDQYTFRTPTLRNVTLTAPYFHSGAYDNLADVIGHHADIWQGAASYDPSAHLPPLFFDAVRPYLPEKQAHSAAPELRNGLPLSERDVSDLVAFLSSLTDPAAADLSAFIPDEVPSGLPLDPLPGNVTQK